jgi:hypothetical protein
MAIKRDYKCQKHGFFEAWEPICPAGCSAGIKIVFLKPPAYVSAGTKHVDGTLKGLASEFKMTNIKSTREGEHQEGYLTRNNAPPVEDQRGRGVIWGGDQRYSMGNVLSGRAVQSVRGESVGFNPRDAGDLRGPATTSYSAAEALMKAKP